MKKLLFAFLSLILLLSCSGETSHYKNPYLPNYSFSFVVNTSLPLYSGLSSAINPVVLTDINSGITMIAMKISSTEYRAWDVYCPNQSPTSCSRMTINGVNAKCACDNLEYSLFTGVGTGQYAMRPFSVEVLGPNLIRIYN
jgi:hypothetical protein